MAVREDKITVTEAAELICRELPPGYEVSLKMEKDAGYIVLMRTGTWQTIEYIDDYDPADDPLGTGLISALRTAKRIAAGNDTEDQTHDRS